MKICLVGIILIAFIGSNLNGVVAEPIRANNATHLSSSGNKEYLMEAQRKTFELEKEYESVWYCLANIGKEFAGLDAEKIGDDKGFREFSPVVTYGLVAVKLQDDNRDYAKAAKYFYLDWVEYKKCEKERESLMRESACDTFGSGPGDYDPLGFAIGQWKRARMYDEVLRHYSEYFDDVFLLQPGGRPRKERLELFNDAVENDPQLKQKYLGFMRDWDEAKQFAKTIKPNPLDPVSQNYEWFYSSKQKEVLKALGYYHQNKVNFMLEKALKHKNPVIAAKAKGYLENLAKGAGHDTKH